MALTHVLISLFVLLLTLNTAVVISLFRRTDIARKQKIYQSVFIFLLPFIGALMIRAFHKNEDLSISEIKRGKGSSGLNNYTAGGTGID